MMRQPPPPALPRGPSGAVTLLSGTLFNLPDLAALLGLSPATVPALVVDAVIRRWGTAGLARLDGDYALAHWSPDQRSLLLATCPMGRDSLYYAPTADGILVASSPSWLLAFAEVAPEPDTDALALRLAKMESRIGDRTPWRAIRRLQPGQCLEWRNGTARIAPFWSPVPRATLRLRRDADYVEAARAHLDRAVAARCPAGAPILCMLSAGLDSTGIVAAAARHHDGPIHTLTVRPDPTVPLLQPGPWQFADEWTRLQPFLAQHPALTAHVTDARQPDLALEYPGSPLQSRDWPFKSPYQFPWLADPLERTAREQGIAVVLSGEAGNVTLSYTGTLVPADQLRSGRWLAAWRNAEPYAPGLRGRLRGLLAQGVRPLLPASVERLRRRLRGQPTFWWQDWSSLRPEVAQRLDLDEHDRPRVHTGSPDLDRHIHLIDHHRQNHAQYAHVFQGRAQSWRDPYSDLGLVEFCLSLPREQFRRDGVGRRLARRVLAGRVPDSIRLERRIGLQHADWFSWMGARRDWMAAEIARIERSPLARSILDTQAMRRTLDAWPASPAEAARFPTSHRLRKGLGEALRVGQFILMQEGRNE